MAKFKNITIKKRGGGTRLQRVKVLASGKYKFVKNIKRKLSRSKRTRRKSNPKRRRRRNPVARRKRRNRGGFSTASIFKLFRIGALVAPGVTKAMEIGGAQGVVGALGEYGGINAYTKQFDWNSLARSWTPFFAVSLVTYGIPKLMGLIRRL